MDLEYRKLFGLDFDAEKLEVKGLPIYLTARRSFQKLSRGGREFVLVRFSDEEKYGVAALQKQADLLSERFGMPVAFGFKSISRAQRNSLIDWNIPFISDSGQLYLPFLGMALSERFVQPKKIRTEKMMPVTQSLFLYMLYRDKGRPVMKKDAAEAIGVTRTSLTRASEQLVAMGLISQEKTGKEYLMTTERTGIDLYEKAKPYLVSPVQRTVTVKDSSAYRDYPLAGESALARKTMLNDPWIPARAVLKSGIRTENLREVDIRWEPDIKTVELELWKYDPALFASDGTVDPVSLAMSLEDSGDERIENAVREYLEGYQW